MPMSDISIFAMLRTKMHWHQERQRLLAGNVANADLPRFKPSDLAAPDFESGAVGPRTLAMLQTNPAHLAAGDSGSAFAVEHRPEFEVVPSGNGVNLEDEMMKVAANQMDYQAASALYARGLGLIKTAIGK
jgi:flagellar basal-body rod protein FlgB